LSIIEKLITAEDAEGAERKTGSVLIFSAFSAFSAVKKVFTACGDARERS
jgi:hypothetical protein